MHLSNEKSYTMIAVQQDNKSRQKALIYAIVSYVLLAVILFLVRWSTPAQPPVLIEDGIEVNLGNSDEGLGEEPPLIPGPPSASNETSYDPPKTSSSTTEQMKDVDTDESDEAAPEIAKPTRPSTSTKITDKPVNKTVKKAETVTPPAPKPQPKAVYKGGTAPGPGGNNADTYNKSTNQGIAGGKGDQGKINGNPDSDSYTGNGGTGKSGVAISRGLSGRRITTYPSFEDDFNENAKVAVDIRVDQNGRVVAATFQQRGSTTSNPNLKAIAIEKAKKIKMNASPDSPAEQVGTIIFNFKVRG